MSKLSGFYFFLKNDSMDPAPDYFQGLRENTCLLQLVFTIKLNFVQTEQLLCWNGMTDTEQTSSGSNREELTAKNVEPHLLAIKKDKFAINWQNFP